MRGEPVEKFQLGMELQTNYTKFAQGDRLLAADRATQGRERCDPQTYGIDAKELREIDPAKRDPYLVPVTVGLSFLTEKCGDARYHMKSEFASQRRRTSLLEEDAVLKTQRNICWHLED